MKVAQSCPTLLTQWTVTCQASLSMEFSRQKYWKWVAIPFSRESSRFRDWTWVSFLHLRQIPYHLSHQIITHSDCSAEEDTWEALGMQEDQTSQSQRKSNLKSHWKDWYWGWSSNTLATWCKKLAHWKRQWCWERLKAGEGSNRVGWHHWLNGHEFEQTPGDGERQGGLVCHSSWGH